MSQPFDVVPYSIAALADLMSKHSSCSLPAVKEKVHLTYFEDYFRTLQAKTIVVEKLYIDRAYLEDFAAYYVRCFRNYASSCSRLHFFSSQFDETQFVSSLQKEDGAASFKEIGDSYLGFIVLKPLPKTIVGRTCLKTYPDENRRSFPTIRKHSVHLFGIPLEIQTVAFQEQDKVVAACATSALWSIFQCTAKLFEHSIPSPVEITRTAARGPSRGNRALPNAGLQYPEIAEAISDLGLEPYILARKNNPEIETELLLKATVYAYLKARIPLFLGIDMFGVSEPDADSPEETGKQPNEQQKIGHHGVAITGYSCEAGNTEASEQLGEDELVLTSRQIEKIFVHDDQVGPFAKMEIKADNEGPFLTTSQRRDGFQSVIARHTHLVAPLYHKIRIPFNSILVIVSDFNKLFAGITPPDQRAEFGLPFEWDIHLAYASELKQEVINLTNAELDVDGRVGTLTKSLPKYLWRATAISNSSKKIDLLFDATDIEQGQSLLHVIEYDKQVGAILEVVHMLPEKEQEKLNSRPSWQIIDWFEPKTIAS